MAFNIKSGATLLEIVSDVCRLVSYPAPLDAAGSTDPAIVQMVAATNQALLELAAETDWQALISDGTISVVADSAGQKQKGFDMPQDFDRWLNQTQWVSQSQMPGLGPISPQGWQLYTTHNASPQMSLMWQVRGGKLYVLTPPYPNPVDFTFQYVSKATAVDGIDPATLKNFMDKNTDSTRLDGNLVMLLARLKWLEYKGFDTTAATRDYGAALEPLDSGAKGAPVLSLSRRVAHPYLGLANIPDTGYGL